MSKLISLIIVFFLSLSTIGQNSDLPRLNFDDYHLPKAIVVNVEGKNKAQLKAHVEHWIGDYYTESSLLDSQFSKHTFFITGLENRLLKVKNLPCDIKYQLKISLRDYKYRLELTTISYKYYTEFRPIASVNLIKDEKIKTDLTESRSVLSSFFNNLNIDLINSITTNQDEW